MTQLIPILAIFYVLCFPLYPIICVVIGKILDDKNMEKEIINKEK